MAFIVGLLTDEERKELEKRGWEIEPCPKELIPEDVEPGFSMGMVYIDTDMIDVLKLLSGPSWNTENDDAEKT